MPRWVSLTLRIGFSTLALGACAHADPEEPEDAFGAVCAEARYQKVTCVEPGTSVQGSEAPATFDAHNCQIREETKNSCCNDAEAGPRLLDGKCCYVFCDRACC